ncbi:MAG TPA: sigma-70 family RNA polymerase sigma factor [Draconibacterium sp.]|nr:sigma-70 family RNA polymerase sigma factor [Draconibacterium sp.]
MRVLTIEEHLLNISDKEENLKEAEKCFETLYRQNAELLTNAVKAYLKSKGIYNEEFVHTVVSNTFCEVYQNPLNFKYDSKRHRSEETAFRAWLYIIARNEFVNIFQESLQYNQMHQLGNEDDIIEKYAEIDIDENYVSENRKALEQAMSLLTERERHILTACYDYYDEGKNTPSLVLDSLCEYWGTTRDNVRQIKKRSLDKVKKSLEKLTTLKVVK